ncbi:MAG: (2Fe-2S)-binding protein [Spirochaetaceae bacterium]|nr:MAG: (2Fe-2S)-binding protein [Spirochaetaceae bacterium]
MKRYQGVSEIELHINGRPRRVTIRPGDTLLRTLRETLGLVGTKMGCENGDCGACTVLLDGVPIKSCITLTLDAEGRDVTTIEGLSDSPIQRAFIESYGFQCGFCTPGMILNAHALLQSNPSPGAETVRSWMESNLCRCTGYEPIENAIRMAAGIDSRE